jgi:hypothetical protein
MTEDQSHSPRLFERAFGRADDERPRWLLALSLLSMLVAGGTALFVGWITGGALFCTATTRPSGAEIPLAAHVVLGACSCGFIASIFARERPLLLSLILSLTVCALLTSIVLVASNSAVTTADESCDFMGTYSQTVTEHVGYVYAVWGVAVAVLLLQLRRAIRFCAGAARSVIAPRSQLSPVVTETSSKTMAMTLAGAGDLARKAVSAWPD